MPDTTPPHFQHVAVQTRDMGNAVAWYVAFLGCEPVWTLTEFSEVTLERLPGIRQLTELVVGNLRLHVFERDGRDPPLPGESVTQFQHLCLAVDAPDALEMLRSRWIELHESQRYTFAVDEAPTEVLTDADGVQSFYALDVNGLELEFTFVPTLDS